MTPLERELVDLGAHLDHGDGEAMAAAVARRLDDRQRGDRRPAAMWLKVAAVVFVALALALGLPPTRRAIARFFGIGTVEIRTVATTPAPAPPSASTVPGAPETSGRAPGPTTPPPVAIADAQRRVGFALRPAGPGYGAPQRVDVDTKVPGGLVALVYDRFTIVEIASGSTDYPIIAKLAPPGVTTTFLEVAGRTAVWVEGAHEIAYMAPDGAIRKESVRRSGSVLLWVRDRVTYRIEGFDRQEDAVAVATSMG